MTYNIITLKNGGFTAKINASLGANLISLRDNLTSSVILREPDYSVPLDNPYLFGAPLLFPVNRIEGGEFEFEGRNYTFPINEEKTGCHIHGVLHQTEFKVESLNDNKAVLSYLSTKNSPYLNFLHEFKVKITYKLTKKGINVKTEFFNLSSQNMPILFGYHTTFNSVFKSGGETAIKVGFEKEIERNMSNYLPTGKLLDFDAVSNKLLNGEFNPLSQPISRHYKCEKAFEMAIYDKINNLSVVYKNGKNMPFRLIYNGNADGYICLEPNSSMANAVNSPFSKEFAGFNYIKPHSKIVYNSQIKLLKGKKL